MKHQLSNLQRNILSIRIVTLSCFRMYSCSCVHHEGVWGSSCTAPLTPNGIRTTFIYVLFRNYSQE
jgi:hypothetical protein